MFRPIDHRSRGAGRLLLLATLASVALLPAVSVLWAVPAKCSGRESDPDCVLYLIARKCVDTSAPDYCTACPSPRVGYCPDHSTCESTTEVWTGTTWYLAIRDKTMCSCPQVVHGLVLPQGAVTGVEDPDRPPTIWKFAWSVAAASGIEEGQAVLIANPPAHRTQNQLHIHVLPIDPLKIGTLEKTPHKEVTDLSMVWAAASAVAEANALTSYGILVHGAAGAWHVHVGDVPLTDFYSLLPTCGWTNRKR